MADSITDAALRKEIQVLLDGKAKSLLDSNQLTMRVMRTLLEEKLGLPAGTLDSQKKTIATIVKETLDLEPVRGAEATAAADAAPGSGEKENRQPAAPGGKRSGSEKPAKAKPKAEGAVAPKRDNGKAKPSVGSKRPAPVRKGGRDDDDDRDGGSGSDGGSDLEDNEERGARQQKRAKKSNRSSPGPGAGAKGKSLTNRAIEMMKEVCKKATIKISPTMYTKNKTVEELEEALSELLARHGLNARSGEREILQVRRQLERDRDLEGIDTSNIISLGGGRPRRAAAAAVNFSAMFKQPKVDSGDEEGEEEEEQEAPARKRPAAETAAAKRAAKGGDADEKGDGSGSRDNDSAGGSEGSEDVDGEAPKRGKAKGKAAAGELRCGTGNDDEDRVGDDNNGASASESEDVVGVTRRGHKGSAKGTSEGREGDSDGEEEPAAEKKKTGKVAAPQAKLAPQRKLAVVDDDEEEEEEASESEEDVAEDDDSDFEADDDDDE